VSTWEPERVFGHGRADAIDSAVVSYLEKDLVHNAMDVWNLQSDDERYELYVSRTKDGAEIGAHIGIFHNPEANYVAVGGRDAETIAPLLRFIPPTSVVTLPALLYEPLKDRFRSERAILTDMMVVTRGEERLVSTSDSPGGGGAAARLTEKDAAGYSTFGRSFNAPPLAVEWARGRIERELVFGAFHDGMLVAVASVVAWLPNMAVIIGVETKEAFRGRGFGSAVVSAAVHEALSRSSSCSLGVRSNNIEALRMYRRLGFVKVDEEFWVDIGTGLTP
jgi:ribosomal protein S18 acetylase RimI-like enzyme